MITGITIENFKGIRDRVHLDFRPITLLFGANSAGKSTILHALHYAREVFERHNLDADETIAGGKYIDLGGFKRLVHREDEEPVAALDSPIRMRIDLQVSHRDLKSFDPDIDGLIARTVADISSYKEHLQSKLEDITWLTDYRFDTLLNEIKSASVELEIGWSATHACPYVSKNTIYFDDEPFIQLEANEQMRGVAARFLVHDPSNRDGTNEVSTLSHKRLKRAGDRFRERGELPLDDRPLLAILQENCGELLSFQKNQIDLDGLIDALPPLDEALFFSPSMISPTGESEYDFRHAFHISLGFRSGSMGCTVCG